MNFSIEAIDDLKIAVEEAFLMVMDCCAGHEAKVYFKVLDDSLEVLFEDLNISPGDLDDKYHKHKSYGFFIIEALVDEFEFIKKPTNVDLRLVKKRD